MAGVFGSPADSLLLAAGTTPTVFYPASTPYAHKSFWFPN